MLLTQQPFENPLASLTLEEKMLLKAAAERVGLEKDAGFFQNLGRGFRGGLRQLGNRRMSGGIIRESINGAATAAGSFLKGAPYYTNLTRPDVGVLWTGMGAGAGAFDGAINSIHKKTVSTINNTDGFMPRLGKIVGSIGKDLKTDVKASAEGFAKGFRRGQAQDRVPVADTGRHKLKLKMPTFKFGLKPPPRPPLQPTTTRPLPNPSAPAARPVPTIPSAPRPRPPSAP